MLARRSKKSGCDFAGATACDNFDGEACFIAVHLDQGLSRRKGPSAPQCSRHHGLSNKAMWIFFHQQWVQSGLCASTTSGLNGCVFGGLITFRNTCSMAVAVDCYGTASHGCGYQLAMAIEKSWL
jgi:hypothetical protein